MNHHFMLSEQLQNFGLTKGQSAVLGYLLENKEAKASLIARSIGHPRGVVYKILEELLAMDLVEKREKEGQVARFRAAHPQNIEKILEEREKKIKKIRPHGQRESLFHCKHLCSSGNPRCGKRIQGNEPSLGQAWTLES